MLILVSIIPIALLLVMLSVFKRPAWQAAIVSFGVTALIAFALKLPGTELVKAALSGVEIGLCPVGIVIIAALYAYAVTVETGKIDEIKSGLVSLSSDRKFLALLIVWGFGNFMEGMAGFGTAVAIPVAILVAVGFDPVRAILMALVANTTPTAFGSVGVPSLVLASEAECSFPLLAREIALVQMSVTALGPFLILLVLDGWRGIREGWRLALYVSIVFIVASAVTAAFLIGELPDIVGGIAVMVALAVRGNWRGLDGRRQLVAWAPFICVVAVLTAAEMIPKDWKPTPGVLVFIAATIGAVIQRLGIKDQMKLVLRTLGKYALAVFTICTILAMAKMMIVAGMIDTLAEALVALTGSLYCFFSPFVGALGGFITGSGTNSCVLFGKLQGTIGDACGARYLFAAANVMGAGIGKMICPQSIVLGCAAAGLLGRESEIFKKALPYFIVVILLAGLTVSVFRILW